jgi:2-methylcitrate dehydratase PrpD
MGPTSALSERVARLTLAAVPAAAVEVARAALIDGVGVAIAGSTHQMSRIVSGYVDELGCAPVAGTLAGGRPTSAENSALVGGVAGHALDFDDTWMPGGGTDQATASHPTCSLVPVLVALAQDGATTGAALVESLLAGLEAHGKVGFPGRTTIRAGWHGSAVFGAVGAAVTAARLTGLDATGIRTTIALAVTHAGGLNVNRGTMAKPYQIGNVAAGAVRAAALVARGFTAADDVLEGRHGFAHAFLDDAHWDPERFVASLDGPLSVLDPGIDMKRYASCLFTHRALDATLEMVDRHQVAATDVDRITVTTSPGSIVDRPAPRTGLEGKFSLQFTVAQAVLHRRVGFRQFDDAALRDPALVDLMSRVDVVADPTLTSDYALLPSPVRVRLRSGTELADPVAVGADAWCRRMSADELADKYLDNTGPVLGAEPARRSLDLLARAERLTAEEVGELLAILTSPQRNGVSP